jgi:septum formation protein
MHLILASQSKDRKMILDRAHIPIQVIPSHFDEAKINLPDPQILLQEIALKKASIVKKMWLDDSASSKREAIIIAADTMGYFEGNLIGKPENKQDAFNILTLLSGNTHEVFTAVVLLHTHSEKTEKFLVKTLVHFQELTSDEISTFLDSNDEYKDRAAAYSIQDRASLFIDSIQGSYTNVIGLPLAQLRVHLKKFQINLFNGP